MLGKSTKAVTFSRTAVVAAVLALLAAASVASAGAKTERKTAESKTIAFEKVNVPVSDAQKRAVTASPSVTIDGKKYQISYNVLMRSGNVIGGALFVAIGTTTAIARFSARRD